MANPNGRGRDWTRKELDEAVRLVLSGLSHKQVGERIGRTKQAVMSTVGKELRRLGKNREAYHKRYKDYEFQHLVVRFCRPGVSDKDVAAILGCSDGTVFKIRHRLGLPAGRLRGSRPSKVEVRPPGYVWAKGELTRCIIRLLALNNGMGVAAVEMGRLLNHDSRLIESMISLLMRGVRDEMDPDAKPLPRPEVDTGVMRKYNGRARREHKEGKVYNVKWGKPLSSKKHHIFREGRSLCLKWLYSGADQPVKPGEQTAGPGDCKVCVRCYNRANDANLKRDLKRGESSGDATGPKATGPGV